MYSTPDDGSTEKPEAAHRPSRLLSQAATLNDAESVLDMVHKTTPRIDDDLMLLSQLEGECEASSGSDPSPPDDLDTSLDSHFHFIQEVSTSQELDQLLPNVTKALVELTDVKACLLKQGTSSGTLTAADQLSTLARLCFTRAMGACWMIPSMDLLVRCKLNIIGRHLFLEEKLSKLTAAATMILPPRLTPEAIEAFLDCSWLSGKGCSGMMARISQGVESALSSNEVTPPMEAQVDSRDLVQIMASMLRETEASLTNNVTEASLTNGCAPGEDTCDAVGDHPSPSSPPSGHRASLKGGQGPSWAFILAGPPSRTLLPSLQTAADKANHRDEATSPSEPLSAESRRMADDLRSELVAILSSHRFSEALRSAVQHAFRQLARHIYDALPPAPLVPSPNSAGGGGGGMQRSMSHLFGSVPSGGFGGKGWEGGGETRPLARMLRPMQGAADLLLVPGNVRGLTKGISELTGVMALSAEVFSGPPCTSSHNCF